MCCAFAARIFELAPKQLNVFFPKLGCSAEGSPPYLFPAVAFSPREGDVCLWGIRASQHINLFEYISAPRVPGRLALRFAPLEVEIGFTLKTRRKHPAGERKIVEAQNRRAQKHAPKG